MSVRSRMEAISVAIAMIFLTSMGRGVLASDARTLPTSAEQEKMRSEVYFPKAKRDTSAMLLVKMKSLSLYDGSLNVTSYPLTLCTSPSYSLVSVWPVIVTTTAYCPTMLMLISPLSSVNVTVAVPLNSSGMLSAFPSSSFAIFFPFWVSS